jgi:glycosyltransferase involved in cell wall biosynthesis
MFLINSLGAGGTERSTAVLLPYLRDRGIDPLVVCFLHRDEGDEKQVIADGFDVRFVDDRSWPGRIRAVRALLRSTAPAVLHTAIFEADIVGRLAAVRTGVPVISSLVNTPYAPERLTDPNVVAWKLAVVREIDSATGRLFTRRFHAVTTGVARDAARTLRLRPERITVVERGRDPDALGRRDPERRQRVRSSLELADDDRLVLAVGREEFQKGHAHLVEAARILAASRPELTVAIAGRRGNATSAIDAAVAADGLADVVRRLGHRDDVADLLAAADVFAMPSLYEGTAGAAIEAMALDAPIVSTRLDGTVGVLEDGRNARLVPVADDAALARAIAEVLDDPDAASARAAAGRADFEERFTLERSATRMAELYHEVAGS